MPIFSYVIVTGKLAFFIKFLRIKGFMYLITSVLKLNRLRRPVGRMTADEQHLEGEFRYVNSRLITNR